MQTALSVNSIGNPGHITPAKLLSLHEKIGAGDKKTGEKIGGVHY